MWLQGLASVAAIAASIATVVLVIATLRYVKATKDMLTEMREARIQEYRPLVVLDFATEYTHWYGSLLYIVVKNIGRRVARNIRFVLTSPARTANNRELSEQGCFRDGLKVMSPGREVRFLFGSFSDVFHIPSPATKTFEVTVTYDDVAPEGSQRYEEAFLLDAAQFEGIDQLPGRAP